MMIQTPTTLSFVLIMRMLIVSASAFAFVPSARRTTLLVPSMAQRVSCHDTHHHQKQPHTHCLSMMSASNNLVSRRSWIAGGAAVLTTTFIPHVTQEAAAYSAAETFETYKDETCGFQISVPATWEKSEQSLPDRRKIVFFMDPTKLEEKTLLFVAFTPIRDDFTSISSLGTVDQVAQATVLPRGKIQGEDTESALISAKSKNNAYYFDYTVKTTKQPETHFRAIFSMALGATGGAGNVLITLTAQTPEHCYQEMKPIFDSIIDSYGKIQA